MEYKQKAGELCELIWKAQDQRQDKLDIIMLDAKKTLTLSGAQEKELRKYLSDNFMSTYKMNFKVDRKADLFKKRYETFMQKPLHYMFINEDMNHSESTIVKKGGRPRITVFEEAKSDATKRRIAAEIASTYSVDALTLALEMAKKKADSVTDLEFIEW